ncbi:MAG: hypothetical protein ACPF9D_14035, partial [Owenweeksia sp.]
ANDSQPESNKAYAGPVQQLTARGLRTHGFTDNEQALIAPEEITTGNDTPAVQKTPERGRFELRVFAGPEFSLNTHQYHPEEERTHKDFAEATDDAVQPGLGWDAGLELRYRVWKGIRISSGFGLRKMITRNQYQYAINEIPVIDSASGNILAYLPSTQPEQRSAQGSNTFTYLSIPLSLTYEYPINRRWALTGEAVYQHSFLLDHGGTEVDPTTLELRESKNDDLVSDMGAYQLRLGLRYQLNDNLFISLEPAYRSTFKDIYQSGNSSWKPRDIALNMIMIYQLK